MDAYFLFSWAYYLRMELLSYTVTVYLPYGNYVLKNCQTAFQRGCTILHPRQQCMRVLICPHPCQHIIVHLLYYSHSSGYEVVSPYGLISISLKTNYAEYLFICFLAIYIFSFGEMTIKSFVLFLTGLFIFLLLSIVRVLYVFWIQAP